MKKPMNQPTDDLSTHRGDPPQRDRLICACFGLSAGDIVDAYNKAGSSYERLVRETKVGMKCTACLLDLDLLLDGLVRAQPRPSAAIGKTVRAGLFSKPEDQVNCGHYVEDGEVSTVLRIANFGFMFERDTSTVEYDYRLVVFAADGRLIHRRAGRLASNDHLEIQFADIPRIAKRGWFIIDLQPRARGVAGSIRPQVGIVGPDWGATYHPQWLSFRTKRRAILASAAAGEIDLFPVVINIEDHSIELSVNLLGVHGEYRQTSNMSIGPRSLVEIDGPDLFKPPASDEVFLCGLEATSPINLFVVNKHRDGSWCVDHFPNEK